MDTLKTILIVEDDPDLRDLMKEVLQMLNCRPLTVSNGRKALEYLQTGELPALIILDLMMPEISGWELREHILGNPAWAGIPVVIVTGVADAASAAQQIQAAAYLTKPFGIPELLDIVGRYC